MPSAKGRQDVDRFFAQLPEKLLGKVLVGAGRAAAKVIAKEAKSRSISHEVSEAIKVATKRDGGQVIAKVQVKGKGAYIAPWLEYGTSPHFISVDASQSGGRSVARINKLTKDAGGAHSLVINGKFVGDTVHHPGARPHPFLRVSLDTKEREAISAAQSYIDAQIARMRRAGLDAAQEGGE